MPSNSSHPCSWANSKKSIAALFCNVVCLIESTSSSKSDIAFEVAFVCFVSQHPNLFNCARAPAEATPGVKKEATMIAPGDQNPTLDLHSGEKAWVKRLVRPRMWRREMFKIIEVLGVSRVKRPSEQGPPFTLEGMSDQALSPHIKKIPSSKHSGWLEDTERLLEVYLH